MATLDTNFYLQKFVDPQLLVERRNYRADFMEKLGSVPATALSADGVHKNKLINNVEFRVNNTQRFTAKSMNGGSLFVPWSKFDTTPTSCTDAEVRALSFDKRAAIRVKHNEAFQLGMRDYVLHKLAPEDATNKDMPVILTTGAADASGRKRLCYEDLVNFATSIKLMNLPDSNGIQVILSPQHMGDLLLDKEAAKFFLDRTFYVDPKTGKPKGFMGLNFYENNDTPYYKIADKTKVAQGTKITAEHTHASTWYYAPNTFYHIDSVKSLYSPAETDTKSADPTSEYRTQTYGIVDIIEDFGIGAFISTNE